MLLEIFMSVHAFHLLEGPLDPFVELLLRERLPIVLSVVLSELNFHSIVVGPLFSYKLFEALVRYFVNAQATLHNAVISKLQHVLILHGKCPQVEDLT